MKHLGELNLNAVNFTNRDKIYRQHIGISKH